jgi:hypothetical protein
MLKGKMIEQFLESKNIYYSVFECDEEFYSLTFMTSDDSLLFSICVIDNKVVEIEVHDWAEWQKESEKLYGDTDKALLMKKKYKSLTHLFKFIQNLYK